jgi:RNA polymerase sigma factor (TIGR02999 family)
MPADEGTAGPGDALPPTEELFALAYDELRGLARAQLAREHGARALQATELVNEAYVRLARSPTIEWAGRTHFFAVAARAMRRVLVDQARARGRKKRGAHLRRVTLGDGLAESLEVDLEDLLDLDRAIEKLASLDSRQAEVVELRFFGGFTMSETAEALDVSKRTVEGDWAHARAWLHRELGAG